MYTCVYIYICIHTPIMKYLLIWMKYCMDSKLEHPICKWMINGVPPWLTKPPFELWRLGVQRGTFRNCETNQAWMFWEGEPIQPTQPHLLPCKKICYFHVLIMLAVYQMSVLQDRSWKLRWTVTNLKAMNRRCQTLKSWEIMSTRACLKNGISIETKTHQQKNNFPISFHHFPWISRDFPSFSIDFPWFPSFSIIFHHFPWISRHFPWISRHFPWISRDFPSFSMDFPWFPHHLPGPIAALTTPELQIHAQLQLLSGQLDDLLLAMVSGGSWWMKIFLVRYLWYCN